MPTAKITSKGQITIPRVVDEVRGDIRDLKGFLKRRGQKRLSVEEMDAAILRALAKKR